MNKTEMEAMVFSTAEALVALSKSITESAERSFATRAELEAVRVIAQALMATLQGEPAFESQLQSKLRSAIEADRIVSLYLQ